MSDSTETQNMAPPAPPVPPQAPPTSPRAAAAPEGVPEPAPSAAPPATEAAPTPSAAPSPAPEPAAASTPESPAVAPPAGTPPAPIAPPSIAPVAGETPTQAVMDAGWPFKGYRGPQPWEAVNTPELTQNHTMVSAGASGQAVVELAALLGALGYGTSIGAGQNPHAIYDAGIASAVRAFCEDYGAAEDPAVLRARTADTVGPWLWETLTRAVAKQGLAHVEEADA